MMGPTFLHIVLSRTQELGRQSKELPKLSTAVQYLVFALLLSDIVIGRPHGDGDIESISKY